MLTLAVTVRETHPRGGYPDNHESLGSIQMHSSFWTWGRSAKRPPHGKIQRVDCLECIIEHPCTLVHHHFLFVFCFSGMRACFAFLFLLATTFALSVGWKRILFDRKFVEHFYIFIFAVYDIKNIHHLFLSVSRLRANLMENIIGCTRLLISPRKRYGWAGWTKRCILNKWFHVVH